MKSERLSQGWGHSFSSEEATLTCGPDNKLSLHAGSAPPSWGLISKPEVLKSKVHARLWLSFYKIQLSCTL